MTETIPRPIDHAPNTYIEMVRMIHNLFSTVLFSYKLALGILLFQTSLNIIQRYLPSSINSVLRLIFLMIRATVRPVQFSISLGSSWLVMLPFYGVNQLSLKVRKKTLISPHHIDTIGSFVFGSTQLAIEFFFPQLYLQRDNFSQTYQQHFKKVLRSNKTLLDTFIFGGHDSAHYTPYISVQHMNFNQQLQFGTNFFHFELLNRPTSSQSCNIWIVHGGKNLNWPLLPLEKGLEHLNDALNRYQGVVISLILDDVAGSYPTSCLIQSSQTVRTVP